MLKFKDFLKIHLRCQNIDLWVNIQLLYFKVIGETYHQEQIKINK